MATSSPTTIWSLTTRSPIATATNTTTAFSLAVRKAYSTVAFWFGKSGIACKLCPSPGPQMFDDLSDLYQQVILDHCKHPRNFHELPAATCSAQGHNPLCGDQLKLYLTIEGDVIKDAAFIGSGC